MTLTTRVELSIMCNGAAWIHGLVVGQELGMKEHSS